MKVLLFAIFAITITLAYSAAVDDYEAGKKMTPTGYRLLSLFPNLEMGDFDTNRYLDDLKSYLEGAGRLEKSK